MSLSIPKNVVVYNPKLRCLFYLMLVVTLIGMGFDFIFFRRWAQERDVSKNIDINMRTVLLHFEDELPNSVPNVGAHCSGMHENLTDMGGVTMHDVTCKPRCPGGHAGRDCVSTAEMTQSNFDSADVFVVTFVHEESLPKLSHTPTQMPKTRNFFVPGPESVSLEILYNIMLAEPGIFGFEEEKHLLSASTVPSAQAKGITTAVLDSEGNVWKRLQVGEPARFNMTELLHLAGDRNLLDKRNPWVGDQNLHGASKIGPPYRITGTSLKVVVECFNRNPPHLGDAHRGGHMLCTLSVKLMPTSWVEGEELMRDSAFLTKRTTYGIHVFAEGKGQFEYGDYHALYLHIISIIVVISLPKQIVRLFATRALGGLSTIYRRALYEPLNVQDAVAGMSTQLMVNSAAFAHIQGKDGQTRAAGLSRGRAVSQLSQILQLDDILTEDELEHFVHFCFSQYTSDREASCSLRGVMTDVMTALNLNRTKSEQGEIPANLPAIQMDRFSAASMWQYPVTLDDLAHLFNRSRRIGLLERIFMPNNLLQEMSSALDHLGSQDPPRDCGVAQGRPVREDKLGAEVAQSIECLQSEVQRSHAALQELRGRLEESERRLTVCEAQLRRAEAGVIEGEDTTQSFSSPKPLAESQQRIDDMPCFQSVFSSEGNTKPVEFGKMHADIKDVSGKSVDLASRVDKLELVVVSLLEEIRQSMQLDRGRCFSHVILPKNLPASGHVAEPGTTMEESQCVNTEDAAVNRQRTAVEHLGWLPAPPQDSFEPLEEQSLSIRAGLRPAFGVSNDVQVTQRPRIVDV